MGDGVEPRRNVRRSPRGRLLLLLLLLVPALPLASPDAGAQLSAVVSLRDGRERSVKFSRNEQPLIVAHRFCARMGILDERQGLNVSRVVRKARREDQLLSHDAEIPWAFGGLLLSRPADGAQFPVGVTIPFDIDFLLPPTLRAHDGRGMTVCVDIQSVDAVSLSDRNTTQCFNRNWTGQDDGTTLNLDAISFSGYHIATVTAHPVNLGDNAPPPQYDLPNSDSSTVSFTTVVIGEDAPSTIYFAMTMRDSVISNPMDARGMAFLDGELFFKSTGTSNPGRNYPGIWLPSSGISPRLFLYGDIMSFQDINRRAIDEDKGTVLKHEAPASPKARQMFQQWVRRGNSEYSYSMVDKRFYSAKEQRWCLANNADLGKRADEIAGQVGPGDTDGTGCNAHRQYQSLVKQLKTNWAYDLDLATAAGSLADVQAGRFIFDRFYSLKSMAVSVRLAPSAWRANGYWDGALAILQAAAELGLDTEPAIAASARETSYAKVVGGICQTNDYIHYELGFSIKGWAEFSAAVCDGKFPVD